MARFFLGIDVSTTSAKALLIDEKGAVRGLGHHRSHPADAEAALVRAGPARVVEGHEREHPQGPFGGRRQRRGRGRGRPHRPDARARAPRRRAPGPPPGHPLERPAHRRRVRRDREAGRPKGARPRDGQRRPHRVHRPEDPLGPQPRARGLREGEARAPPEGLRPAAPHRRGGDGQGRRVGHDPLRPRGPDLVEAGPGRARHPLRLAPAHLRGAGGDRHGHRRGRGRDGAPGRERR